MHARTDSIGEPKDVVIPSPTTSTSATLVTPIWIVSRETGGAWHRWMEQQPSPDEWRQHRQDQRRAQRENFNPRYLANRKRKRRH